MNAPAPNLAPRKKNNPLLLGCFAVIALCALAVVGLLFIGWIDQRLETPQQRKARQAALDKEYAQDEARRLAPIIANGAKAQARLSNVAAAVAATADLKATPCPHTDGQTIDFAPVDAPYMRRFKDGLPSDASGVAWLRHEAFKDVGDHSTKGLTKQARAEFDAEAATEADRMLADAGNVAVIHTIALTEPKLSSAGGAFKDGSYDGGSFSGWIQLIDYRTAKTLCEQPFSAQSSTSVGGGVSIRIRGIPINHLGSDPTPQEQIDNDFQSNVWKAAQDAVDR